MRIFNFVILSVITALHNVPTPHISKTHFLLFHLTYGKSNWIDAQKTSQQKREAPLRGGWKPNSPRKALIFIKQSSLSS